MNELLIYKCGTQVSINGPCFTGTITAVQIRDTMIKYEVSFFRGGDYTSYWLSDFEFKPVKKGQRNKIGFHNPEKPEWEVGKKYT